jgi:atypical dual specificity phosphatase
MASVYPKEIEYLNFLKDLENIETVINLAESPWPNDWSWETGISCYHIPIIDMSIPTEDQVKKIIRIIDGSEGPVMIHCAAGIGRTGTLIALYLVDHGMGPKEAIELVRQKRNGSIQTSAQEGMIYNWARIKGEADGP